MPSHLIMRKSSNSRVASHLDMVRFQRYLVRYYPITSAMSYEIGDYVEKRLLAPIRKNSRVKIFTAG